MTMRLKWGPCTVVRVVTYLAPNGRHITALHLHTDDHEVEVHVSAKGRKVKVWRDGRRMR